VKVVKMLMLNYAKHIIYSIPIQEVKEYYCYFTEYCEVAVDEDYRNHLYAKLKMCCRCHKIHGKIMEESTFRAYNMFSWLEYMKERYLVEKV
jgi:hypothetical protein